MISKAFKNPGLAEIPAPDGGTIYQLLGNSLYDSICPGEGTSWNVTNVQQNSCTDWVTIGGAKWFDSGGFRGGAPSLLEKAPIPKATKDYLRNREMCRRSFSRDARRKPPKIQFWLPQLKTGSASVICKPMGYQKFLPWMGALFKADRPHGVIYEIIIKHTLLTL